MMLAGEAAIDYEVRGEGPALLMINGLGFGRWGWFKQVPELSEHFRTITFDARNETDPGRGVEELAAEAIQLLEHLGVEKAHVLGTSLGGFVAQRMALDRPDLVDRLVLVCTSYGGRGPRAASPAAMGRMFGWGALSAESAARRGLETATSDAYRARNPEEFESIVRWRLVNSPSLSGYYGQAMAGARFDSSGEVHRIEAPTLVIHGSDDRYVPVANAVALVEAIPNARLRVLDDAGHLVFIERAEAVNREVTAFLTADEPLAETGAGEVQDRSERSLLSLLKRGARGLVERLTGRGR
jgi:pimeloyl-ACP methyl ester carboxylesterase